MTTPGSTFKAYLIVPAAALLLVVMGLTWWVFRTSEPALPKDQALASALQFLDNLKRGDIEKAWGSTNADFRSYMGKESLKALAKKNPAFKEGRGEPVILDRTPEKQAFEFKSAKTGKKIQVGLAWDKGAPKIESLKIE